MFGQDTETLSNSICNHFGTELGRTKSGNEVAGNCMSGSLAFVHFDQTCYSVRSVRSVCVSHANVIVALADTLRQCK